jgi:hypothetical protein
MVRRNAHYLRLTETDRLKQWLVEFRGDVRQCRTAKRNRQGGASVGVAGRGGASATTAKPGWQGRCSAIAAATTATAATGRFGGCACDLDDLICLVFGENLGRLGHGRFLIGVGAHELGHGIEESLDIALRSEGIAKTFCDSFGVVLRRATGDGDFGRRGDLVGEVLRRSG